ncbi:hypothetical protein GOV06_05885 [Candidatus Woesearchaeota archaeon]|nr:hypothetical protein [Candidatus Woesearchaeota archaeon]
MKTRFILITIIISLLLIPAVLSLDKGHSARVLVRVAYDDTSKTSGVATYTLEITGKTNPYDIDYMELYFMDASSPDFAPFTSVSHVSNSRGWIPIPPGTPPGSTGGIGVWRFMPPDGVGLINVGDTLVINMRFTTHSAADGITLWEEGLICQCAWNQEWFTMQTDLLLEQGDEDLLDRIYDATTYGSTTAEVPEFSTYGIIFALIIAAIGALYVVKKRSK